MSRSTRGQKEYTRLQEIVHENKRLKKEVGSLRKQLARVDLDRFSYVRDIVEEHLAEEKNETSTKDMLASMKSTWTCKECKIGYLEIHLYSRRDGTHYLRQCTNCPHRTKMQRYTPDVKGPIKPESDDK